MKLNFIKMLEKWIDWIKLPGRLPVEEKLGGMTNSMSFFALKKKQKRFQNVKKKLFLKNGSAFHLWKYKRIEPQFLYSIVRTVQHFKRQKEVFHF